MGADIQKILFRDEEFFKKYDINVIHNSEVTNINYDKKFVETKNEKHLHYDGLLIASGGKVRVPPVPGVNL
jgi:NAD(P)H-nitrite reductase large subunit